MSKIVIIEDEKPAARRLRSLLSNERIEADVLLHSVSQAIEWLNNNPAPDLIFADIQLSDGLVFEVFEQCPIKSPVIFTTAYDEYAIKAFKLNSIDYLLKPIKGDELRFSLDKYRKKTLHNTNIGQLLKTLKPENSYKKRFGVQYGNHLQSIPVESIAYFYSQYKTTWLVTVTGEEFIYDQALDLLEKQLNLEHFFRVNRQYIISEKSIKDIVKYTNSRLKIVLHTKNQLEIIVARDRVKTFRNWLEL